MDSEEQIQQWADEAEAGYDAEEIKTRGRGRPGRGAEPLQVVAVRLTADELAALDATAEREHISRSEAIRRTLATTLALADDLVTGAQRLTGTTEKTAHVPQAPRA